MLSDRAISVGVEVRRDVDYLARARDEGWTVVRRSTGGAAVVHAPGDIAWTLVLPRTDPRVGNDYARRYDRLGRAVVRFLEREGVDARWGEALRLGGTISGEHGVGALKRSFVERELGPGGVSLLRSLKRVCDPDGILNPGKLYPPDPA